MASEPQNVYPILQPNYAAVRECARQYPGVDLGALESAIELMRVASEVFANQDAFFSTHKFSRGRFFVLVLLLQNPEGLGPAELADMARVTRATMTGLVDTLESNGFIERRDDPVDRRMHRVVLTEQGRGFMDGYLPQHYRRSAILMSHLSADDRSQLRSLLRKLEDGVRDLESTGKATHL